MLSEENKMAYMSQEKKALLSPKIKSILKKYNVKGSISVRRHMSLVVTIKSGKIDFFDKDNVKQEQVYSGRNYDDDSGYMQVNEFHYQKHFSGQALKFLSELVPAMMVGNHDNSDIMTDYFDVGWYIEINIGNWDKPYILEK